MHDVHDDVRVMIMMMMCMLVCMLMCMMMVCIDAMVMLVDGVMMIVVHPHHISSVR